MHDNENMNDDALRELFGSLPQAGSDGDSFMDALSRRLDVVDEVREAERRKSRAMRRAVWAAAFAGFVSGIVCTLLMPVLIRLTRAGADAVASFIPDFGISDPAVTIFTWLCAGLLCVGIAAETFGITRALADNAASASR